MDGLESSTQGPFSPNMTDVTCFKMTGSGNDFVCFDGRMVPVSQFDPPRIRQLCRRGTGIGADGLFVLEPGSEADRVRFHFFNSDGGRAPMCGNGALCATRLAARLGMAPAEGMVLVADSGDYSALCVAGTEDRSVIALPDVSSIEEPAIPCAENERSIHYIRVGVPHLVVVVSDAAAVPILERGRQLRHHEALRDGANVNFVSPAGPSWTMRTFERGVEDETLACGTGAVASAAVLSLTGQIDLPWNVVTSSGSILMVRGTPDPTADALRAPRLEGEGRLVFTAQIDW